MSISKLWKAVWFSLLALAATPVVASTYQLAPVADTFAYSGEPDLAHGSLSYLATSYTFPHSEAGFISYLKFSLQSIPGNEVITGGTLNLYQFGGGGFVPIGTALFRFADSSWSEATLTWNNQPLGLTGAGTPNFGTLIATNPNGGVYRGWSSWDLFQLSAWNPSADQASGFLSLQLAETYGGDQSHNWCSKETDPTTCTTSLGLKPYLTITTAPVPEPAAVWLLLWGLGGGIGYMARRKLHS